MQDYTDGLEHAALHRDHAIEESLNDNQCTADETRHRIIIFQD